MNETIVYSLQTILATGVFILIYRLFVRNSNAYNWNRFYLLSTMIVSLYLPHLNISDWFATEKPIIIYAPVVDFNQVISTVTPYQPVQIQQSFSLSDFIISAYWLIAILLIIRFGWGMLRIIKLARSNDYRRNGKLIYNLVNQFSYSLIKQRLKMISKTKQSRLAGFRILLAVPTAFVLLMLFSFTSFEKTTSRIKSNIIQPTLQAVRSSIDKLQNPQQSTVSGNTINATKDITDSDTLKSTQQKKNPPKFDQMLLLKTTDGIDKSFPGGNAS